MTDITSEQVTVAVRAWVNSRKESRENSNGVFPSRFLILDTETTVTPDQTLMFGFYRESSRVAGKVLTEREGIVIADDLAATDPVGFEFLESYARRENLEFLVRTDFNQKYLPAAYREDLCIVGFNLPFDLSRIAYSWHETRDMPNGFSLEMFPQVEKCPADCSQEHKHIKARGKNRFRPYLKIKHIDAKKAIMHWGGYLGKENTQERSGGFFLDLRQLVFALCNEGTSLARACEIFDLPEEFRKSHAEDYGSITPDFVEYARQDVRATEMLCERVLEQFDMHPIDDLPTSLYSPASVGKGYFRAMGITPYMERPGVPKDPQLLGWCVSTFYGARAETHIRNTPVPVAVCDFTNMYGTVNTLMKLWGFQTARGISIDNSETELDRFRKFCETVARDGYAPLLDQDSWPAFTGFARIRPDNDCLPVRAQYGKEGTDYNVGINYFTCDEPLWYTYPDILMSCLLTGKVPEILEVRRLIPSAEKLSTLRPVKFLGIFEINPLMDDFFKFLVEKRAELKQMQKDGLLTFEGISVKVAMDVLKVLVNAPAYGMNVEMQPDDKAKPEETTVYGSFGEPWECTPTRVEIAGVWCYPPIGAVITGAARLMLSIVERQVTDLGGTWLFCDTDSMAIVTTVDGRLIPCEGGNFSNGSAVKSLTRAEVQKIRDTMNQLNPYNLNLVPDLLKDETEKTNATGQVYGYGISAKRYCLFTYVNGKPVIPAQIDGKDAYKQHGLGLYLNPADPANSPGGSDWIRASWQRIVDRAHGLKVKPLPWKDTPALIRFGVSSPHLMRSFGQWNNDKSYDESVKPFNFMLIASNQYEGLGTEYVPKRFIAPFEKDSGKWAASEWYDLRDPKSPAVKIRTEDNPAGIKIKSHAGVYSDFIFHKEVKSAMSDGRPCDGGYVGVLSRRNVCTTRRFIRHIGKESNNLEERQANIAGPDESYTLYGRSEPLPIRAAFAGMSAREIARIVNEHTRDRYQQYAIAEFMLASKDRYGVPDNSEIDKATDELILMENLTPHPRILHEIGSAKRIYDMLISRYLQGQEIRNHWVEKSILWTAAEIVAEQVGCDPADIGYSKSKSHRPEWVLNLWADLHPESRHVKEPEISGGYQFRYEKREE